MYASVQTLDFLAMAKNAFFPNWKLLVSYKVKFSYVDKVRFSYVRPGFRMDTT